MALQTSLVPTRGEPGNEADFQTYTVSLASVNLDLTANTETQLIVVAS